MRARETVEISECYSYYGCGKYLLNLIRLSMNKKFLKCQMHSTEVPKLNINLQKICRNEYSDFNYSRKEDVIMLLSNNKNVLSLYEWLKKQGKKVYLYSGKLTESQIQLLSPAFVISYNYKYIIPKRVIELVENRIINLHISYLPWNKGADPNFWSFIDDTPKGVTIHQLSNDLDGGDILLQKEFFFDEHIETFRTTYETLNREIITLLQKNWERVENQHIVNRKQSGEGSFHKREDFIEFMGGESLNLDETIYNYKQRSKLLI